MYCLDCRSRPLCSLCLVHHRDHRYIQIRRSSYHDVIRVNEIQKYLDISGVHTYIINSARVVFLNKRHQAKPGKGVSNTCVMCHRSLTDPLPFCSLGCKIDGTSTDFHPKKKISHQVFPAAAASESEESYYHGDNFRQRNGLEEFSPSTPPLMAPNFRNSRRRKGTPHRAPMSGGLIIEY